MAAGSKIHVGGYQCECVENVSEYYVCALCKYVAREPHVASCCSETFCKDCITPVLEDKKPCPYCETVGFTTLFNVKYEKQILALELRCAMKDRGCEWTGRLEGLEAHLDVNTGDCEYVDVECPNRCDQLVEKRNLHTHLIDLCPKREFTCQYCKFKATHEDISNDHWPQCSSYPVPCPNVCGIQTVERGDLEAHLLQCPLVKVECDFSHAGCNTKLPRQDLERHMEESTQRHLILMSAMCASISSEFEQKLHEQRDEFQRYVEQKERETAEKDEHMQYQLEMAAQQTREQLRQREEHFEHKLQEKDAAIKAVEDELKQDKEAHRMVQRETEETQKRIALSQKELNSKLAEKDAKVRKLQEQTEEKNKEFEQQLEVQRQQIKAVEDQLKRDKEVHRREIEETKERMEAFNSKLAEKDAKIRKLQEQTEEKNKDFERQLQVQRQQIKAKDEDIENFKQQFERKQQESKGKMKALEEKGQQDLQKTTQEFERKLTSQTKVVKEQIQTKTQENEKKIIDLQQQLQQKAEQVEILQKQTAPICSAKYSYTLEISNLPVKHHRHTTQPLYTHPRGYKFRFYIDTVPVLFAMFSSTPLQSLGVTISAMSGEFDHKLKWPVKLTITLQLIDQQRNKDHITETKMLSWSRPTEEECFSQQCILVTNGLERYIKNECVKLQVVKVELQQLWNW